jgi:hypothetical protein
VAAQELIIWLKPRLVIPEHPFMINELSPLYVNALHPLSVIFFAYEISRNFKFYSVAINFIETSSTALLQPDS